MLDPAVRLYHGGRTLVAFGRVIRLTDAGPAALRALLADTATPAQRRLGERLVDAGFAHPRPTPKALDVTTVIPVKDHAVPAVPGRVIVVDDGSRVPIPGAIRRERCGGPAAARNTGVAHVSTRVRRVPGQRLRRAAGLDRAARGAFRRSARAAVAPRVNGKLLDMGPRSAGALRAERGADRPARTARFDEALRYGEDVDLVWRLQARAYGCATTRASSSSIPTTRRSGGRFSTGRPRRRCSSAIRGA